MSRTLTRLAALVSATLLAAAALAGLAGTPAAQAQPAPDRAAALGAAHAKVVFLVDSCEGCTIRLTHAPRYDYDDVWQSQGRVVRDGRVKFSMAARHANNLSATVVAPWESRLGYVTNVVFHYKGEPAGRTVSVHRARTKQRASLCWNTNRDVRRVHLTVRKVRVRGLGGMTDGTLAFATRSQKYLQPYGNVWHGVGGSQDVPFCGQRA